MEEWQGVNIYHPFACILLYKPKVYNKIVDGLNQFWTNNKITMYN